jgi:FMN phosphatase YigB (HAD superfamily)
MRFRCLPASFLLVGLLQIAALPAGATAFDLHVDRTAPASRYAAFTAEAAQRFRIPGAWIEAVLRVESAGNPRAVSPAGAMGLMQVMPGTWAGLRTRYRLGVVTNGIDRVQRSRLSASGIAPLFETIVTSEGSGFAKPDPRILHVALDALGISPSHAVYVGDDLAVDGGAARAAGVPFVWMNRGDSVRGRWPRRRVRHLAELAEIL